MDKDTAPSDRRVHRDAPLSKARRGHTHYLPSRFPQILNTDCVWPEEESEGTLQIDRDLRESFLLRSPVSWEQMGGDGCGDSNSIF